MLIYQVKSAQAWMTPIMLGGGAEVGSACSTPSDGDELNEGFIGVGYENSWSETIGATGVVDEDHTLTGSPPAGSCSEGLLTSVTTSGGATYSTWDRGSAITSSSNDVDVKAEFRINSYTLPNQFDQIRVLGWDADGTPGQGVGSSRIEWNGSSLAIHCQGASVSTEDTISTGTWYTLTIHLDATAASSYCQIDSGAQRTFTRNSEDGQYLIAGPSDLLDADEAVAIEWGRVWINTP